MSTCLRRQSETSILVRSGLKGAESLLGRDVCRTKRFHETVHLIGKSRFGKGKRVQEIMSTKDLFHYLESGLTGPVT